MDKLIKGLLRVGLGYSAIVCKYCLHLTLKKKKKSPFFQKIFYPEETGQNLSITITGYTIFWQIQPPINPKQSESIV